MNDKELKELYLMLERFTSPCFAGHIFTWSSGTVGMGDEPPGYTPCRCGKYTWAELSGTNNKTGSSFEKI